MEIDDCISERKGMAIIQPFTIDTTPFIPLSLLWWDKSNIQFLSCTFTLMDPELKRRLADRAYQSVFSYLKEVYCDDAEYGPSRSF